MIQYVFLIIFFVFTGIDLFSVAKEIKKLEYISKPLLMPFLALFYIFAAWANINWLIVIALICGCAGDTFLMFKNSEKSFMLGMAAFLLGHIFYIISYLLATGANIMNFPIWGLLLFLPVVVILFLTYPKFKKHLGDFNIPVHVYMGTILVMHITAILRLGKYDFFCPCFYFVWIGSLLFILSDSLIAIDSFNKEIKIPYMRVIIMSTYILGQFFITLGILLSI